MKYLSLCSGIEAATVAWHPLGWEAVAYSEIERFPSEVLAHHYPNTPNLGDMTKFKEWSIESNVDLLVGGTPCQSFSVAGLRKGLDDPRGNLMLTYLAIADQYKPKWIVWENVPGVLSSNGGKDFGIFLGALGELGYGFAYRILDAQYFGVAQRRRRVFVVGYLGDWRRAAAVLFERDSLCGDPAPSRKAREGASIHAGKGIADCSPTIGCELAKQVNNQMIGNAEAFFIPDTPAQPIALAENTIGRKPENGGNGDGFTDGGPMYTLNATGVHGVAQPIAYAFDSLSSNSMKSANPISGCNEVDVSKTLDTSRGLDPSCNQGGIGVAQPIPLNTMAMQGRPGDKDGRMGSGIGQEGDPCPTLTKAHSHAVAQPIGIFQDSEYGIAQYDTAGTLRAGRIPAHQMAVAFSAGNSANARSIGYTEEGTPPLRASASGSNQVPTMAQGMAVRRLTPVECERLQGFPDTYTDIKSKGKATPDGPRYKALGNSMAVPVMAWIGKRINEVEAICKPNK